MTDLREMYTYDGKAIKVELTENDTDRNLYVTTKPNGNAHSESTNSLRCGESLLNIHHVQLQSYNTLRLMQTVTRMDARIEDALGIRPSHEEFQHIHKAQEIMLTKYVNNAKLQMIVEKQRQERVTRTKDEEGNETICVTKQVKTPLETVTITNMPKRITDELKTPE